MTHKASLSAIITGHPPGFERPRPQPGRTLADLVIRNFPAQWRGFVHEISADYSVPVSTTDRILAGDLDAADLTVRPKIEDFMNSHLPGYARTIKALAELQSDLGQAIGGFNLLQIVWPSERRPGGETAGQAYAKLRGVEVIALPAGCETPPDLIPLLPFIKGPFAWVLPIGLRIEPFAVAMQLNRTLRIFATDQSLAMYFDGLYSAIYRLSVLRELMEGRQEVSPDPAEALRLMHQAGYRVMHADPPVPLCHLEALYGGRQEAPHRNGISIPGAKRWWQNLFDKPRQNQTAPHQQDHS